MSSIRKLVSLSLLVLLASLNSVPLASAAAISQGYHSSQPLVPGTILARDDSNNTIVAADIAHKSNLLGVVIASSGSSLAITSASAQTQVVTSGMTDALVTDLNGPIKSGDPITTSPISGVGMKATTSGTIVGVAESSTKSGVGTPVTVRSSDGKSHYTTVQSVPINVNVGYYSLALGGSVPGSLQNVANGVAGRTVSVARVVLSSLVLFFAALAVIVVLYTGITMPSLPLAVTL